MNVLFSAKTSTSTGLLLPKNIQNNLFLLWKSGFADLMSLSSGPSQKAFQRLLAMPQKCIQASSDMTTLVLCSRPFSSKRCNRYVNVCQFVRYPPCREFSHMKTAQEIHIDSAHQECKLWSSYLKICGSAFTLSAIVDTSSSFEVVFGRLRGVTVFWS